MNETIKDIILILIVSGFFGYLFEMIKFPKVIGYLVGGVILSPIFFNAVSVNSQIDILAHIGVILIMFLAGLEVNFDQFKKDMVPSFFIGLFGVILPLVVGYLVASLFYSSFYACLFIGAILTATSVSVSVAVLHELGKLNTPVGTKILGAAIIDDVIGLLIVSIILSMNATADMSGISMSDVIINIIAFLIIAGLLLVFVPKIVKNFSVPKNYSILLALIYMFVAAYISELLGIAAITGAFVAGLSLSKMKGKKEIDKQLAVISDNFLGIIFFASIGLALQVETVDKETIIFIAIISVVAILTKLIGCAIPAKLLKSDNKEALRIGLGMISRGEVAIIIARLGLQANIIDNQMFFQMVVVIVIVTVISPLLLKLSYRKE